MKESTFQTNVKKHLKSKGAYSVNIWGGGFQSAGIPDLLVAYNGIFLGLELKVGYNKPSELQLINLELINKTGALGIVFYYSPKWKEELDDILSALDKVDIGPIQDLKQTIQLPERHITKTTKP